MGIKPIFLIVLIVTGALTAHALNNQPVVAKKDSKAKVVSPTPAGKRSIVQLAKDTVQELGGSVLGTATEYVSNIASKSASTVEDFVFDNTVAGVVKQIDKLPQKQQEEIKKAVCK